MNRVLFWRFICHAIAAAALLSAALFFVFHDDKALAVLLVLLSWRKLSFRLSDKDA